MIAMEAITLEEERSHIYNILSRGVWTSSNCDKMPLQGIIHKKGDAQDRNDWKYLQDLIMITGWDTVGSGVFVTAYINQIKDDNLQLTLEKFSLKGKSLILVFDGDSDFNIYCSDIIENK